VPRTIRVAIAAVLAAAVLGVAGCGGAGDGAGPSDLLTAKAEEYIATACAAMNSMQAGSALYDDSVPSCRGPFAADGGDETLTPDLLVAKLQDATEQQDLPACEDGSKAPTRSEACLIAALDGFIARFVSLAQAT